MKRDHFILFLEGQGCVLVRTANQGYAIYRNKENNRMSGVPNNECLKPATICIICKTLDIDTPNEVIKTKDIIDEIHRKHSRDNNQ